MRRGVWRWEGREIISYKESVGGERKDGGERGVGGVLMALVAAAIRTKHPLLDRIE